MISTRVQRTALAAAALLAGSAGAAVVTVNDASAAGSGQRRITNVIYLLGDGMGRTHVTAARERYYGAAGRLHMERMPVVGQVSTYSVAPRSGQPGRAGFVPTYVTDSAASATAWSSGVKSYNGALGVNPKGKVLPTVMEQAKKAGYRTGNVSTAEITDATPAAQVSHVLARGCQGPDYSEDSCQDVEVTGSALPTSDIRVTPIADQIARNGTADVLFGGGLARFDAADEHALEDQGYDVLGSIADQTVATKQDLKGASGRKVFGLFNTGNLTVQRYKALHPKTPQAQEPSLPQMTHEAIRLLKGGDKGFYLQVEGALIDKRSHANDAAQTLKETKAFDNAVKIALDFAKRDGHTLVIVTADHECAGFNIIEKDTFTNAEASTPPLNVDTGNPANNSHPSRPDSQELDPARSTGIINGAGRGDPRNFAPATFRTPDDPAGVKNGSPDASLWLTYLSGNHTGADVPLFAYGPRSGALDAQIDNTDLYDIFRGALGLGR